MERISPPILARNEASTGTLPTISITAKSVKDIVTISFIEILSHVILEIFANILLCRDAQKSNRTNLL